MSLENGFSLFGVGRAAITVFKYFKQNNLTPFCFIDSDPLMMGKYIEGIPILPSTDTAIKDLPIVTTPPSLPRSIGDAFKHDRFITFDRYFHILNAKRIYDTYVNVFIDDDSKHVLENITLANISGNKSYYSKIFTKNQYYCKLEFMAERNALLADFGAFVGDSLERFIWQCLEFENIYALEPSKRQFSALQSRVKRLEAEWALKEGRIISVNCVVGRSQVVSSLGKSTRLSNFSMAGADCDQSIQIQSLDGYFMDKPVSFIKCDIEGGDGNASWGKKYSQRTKAKIGNLYLS